MPHLDRFYLKLRLLRLWSHPDTTALTREAGHWHPRLTQIPFGIAAQDINFLCILRPITVHLDGACMLNRHSAKVSYYKLL